MTDQNDRAIEIEKAAHNYRDKSDVLNEDWNSFSSFKAGAKWADENPSYPPMKKLHQEIGLLRQQLAILVEKIKIIDEEVDPQGRENTCGIISHKGMDALDQARERIGELEK